MFQPKATPPSDRDLRSAVNEALCVNAKVDSTMIALSVKDRRLTLRGVVGSHREKRNAQRVVKRVPGVRSVKDALLLEEWVREDADLRWHVLKALVLDIFVSSTVDAQTNAGFVTLTGTVDWPHQRHYAQLAAANVSGVIDVHNDIRVSPKVAISAAWMRETSHRRKTG